MTLSTHPSSTRSVIIYPESDGKPMADNTLQFRWIVTIVGGLRAYFRPRPDIFVAGDLLWYPVEGDPRTCAAPDAMVTFGRPQGDRRSYKQWEEDGLPPHVVFEVLSPNNTFKEMLAKFQFYDRFGPEEYYLYDPDHGVLEGWRCERASLAPIADMNGWISPRLGIRFALEGLDLRLSGPDGRPFVSYEDLAQQRDDLAQQRDDLAQQRDDLAQQRDVERQRAETAQDHIARLAAQLRASGIEPSP